MPAAARVGDPTSHTPLTPMSSLGSPNVLIGGRPAWRAVTDVHVCPLFSGTVAHVGGIVAKGSTSVFINGFPAARQGDTVMEGGGGPNAILMGCPTVLIGG